METFEGEVRIGGLDEAVRDLRDLGDQLNRIEDTSERAADNSANFAEKLTAGITTARAAFDALRGLSEVIVGLADEFERTSGVLNRFSGDITEAAERTNGLITNLDLMIAQARASAAGLQLTGEQFATVAVRAAEMAAATGEDATDALNSLTDAIIGGADEQLRIYGVSLEGVTDITERQDEAVRQLTDGYGDLEARADTLGGAMTIFRNRLENAATEMVETINQSGALDDVLRALTGTTDETVDTFNMFGDDDGPLSAVQEFTLGAIANLTAFTRQLSAIADTVTGFFTVIGDIIDSDVSAEEALANVEALEDAFDRIGGEQFDRDRREVFNAGRDNVLSAQDGQELVRQANAPRTGSRRTSRNNDGGSDAARAAREAELDLIDKIKEQNIEIEEQELRQLESQRAKGQAAAELAKTEAERLMLLQEQADALAKQKEAIEEAAEAEEQRQQLQRRANRVQDGLTRGAEDFASVVQRSQQLQADGELSRSEAFKTATDEYLRQLAIQEVWEGARASIEAIGFAITNPPAAASKVAEAAGHFALAAAAGGASAAIPNQPAPNSGSDGGASRPTNVGGGTQNDGNGGPVIINYNAPTAEALIGRDAARAERAYQSRFGS